MGEARRSSRAFGRFERGALLGLVLASAVGMLIPEAKAQSRVAERARLGASVTMVLYRARGRRADSNPEPVRLAQTFDSLDAEVTYLRKVLGIEQVTPVHIRSVGLLPGERFQDGVFLGDRTLGRDPEGMDHLARQVIQRTVALNSVSRTEASLSVALIHRERTIVRVEGVEVRHFETILLEGTLSEEAGEPHAMLMTITVTVLPLAHLRNRPRELSAPCDEYGRVLATGPEDVFLPPVLIERVTPKFPSRRPMGSILLEGIVTPEGRVINARVVRPFDREMEAFALEAFQRFRFLPAQLNGRPIHATVREEVIFQTVP